MAALDFGQADGDYLAELAAGPHRLDSGGDHDR